MKKLLFALVLLANVSYAHAYGVVVVKPILKGPLASATYSAFLRALRASGATRCNRNVHSVCRTIHPSIVSGKYGLSYYVVGTAAYIDYRTGTNEYLRSYMRTAWVHSLQRGSASGFSGFTARQWGIDIPLAK